MQRREVEMDGCYQCGNVLNGSLCRGCMKHPDDCTCEEPEDPRRH